MTIKLRPTFSDSIAPVSQNGDCQVGFAPFLALTLFLPAIIVAGNFAIGAVTPITLWYEDDFALIDPVWRLIQGSHFGTDFHDPRGFGFFYVASVLWRLIGPHYEVLRASADLFALVIVFCGCVVALRRMRRAAGLAALFCITVAFEATGPSIYGLPHDYGMAISYDRLIMSALAVLFVQSFAGDSNSRRAPDYLALFVAALLLNILFLIKISGLVVGLLIVGAGFFVRGRFARGAADIFLIALLLVAMLALDFVATGTDLSAVIHEYQLAAKARTGAYSVRDGLRFALQWPILSTAALISLYAVSRPSGQNRTGCWQSFVVILVFWVCQVVLNMSNATLSPDLLFLAPAAAVAVVTWTDTPGALVFWNDLWNRFYPRRLHEVTARQIIPLFVLGLVLAPEALATFRAIRLDHSVFAGNIKPITVTANDGIALKIFTTDSYDTGVVLSLNRAIEAIERLDANREVIANLDFVDPFPALFRTPDPKGTSSYWDLGNDVPKGYKPTWQEIIGDACIVTEPKHPIANGKYSPPLIEAVEPHLASAFTLIYEDEMWKIWKKRAGCAATME